MKFLIFITSVLFLSPVFASDSLEKIYSDRGNTVISPVEYNNLPVYAAKKYAAALCLSIGSKHLVNFDEHKLDGVSYNTISSTYGVISFKENKQVKPTLMLKSVTCAN